MPEQGSLQSPSVQGAWEMSSGFLDISLLLIKDRNGMDLTEAEDIKKRWQEYTEELYQKRSS